MGYFSGQVVLVNGEKYEVLRVDNYNNIVSCRRFNSIETKIFDFSVDELEGEK